MQHANSLPARTLSLLQRLSRRDDLEGFTLIGGTSLALRHGHRLSEDIDLAWHGSKLPRRRIRALLDQLAIERQAMDIMDPFQKQLAENDGIDLDDYHQDWEVEGVKLTFFAPDEEEASIISRGGTNVLNKLAIADDETIFKLKSRVVLDRTVSRDLFDLWYFIEHEGRSVQQIVANMREKDKHQTLDALLLKLSPSQFREADPLFETILEGAPKTGEELLARMGGYVDEHRRLVARNAALQASQGRGY